MSTLAALAKAEAAATGRAVPVATVRHVHVSDRPLVLIPLAMASEANAPLAAMVGCRRSDPALLVVAQPHNRDQRFAFAAELGDLLCAYVEAHTAVAEPVAVDRGRDVRYRYADAPQLWVPNPGGVEFLRLFGRSTRFRSTEDGPAVPLLGRWLTFLANAAEMPGSALLVTAVQALALHWASGQSSAEDAHLGSLLAWIGTGAAAARAAEAGPAAGPATDPSFDNDVLAPMIESGNADELTTVLREQLTPVWEQMWRVLDLLRALPAGARVGSRWDSDRDAFSGFVQYLADGGPPQPRRDGAVAAAARLHQLEAAAARYEVQRAFDDPLVMAQHRLTGTAFAGDVTLAQPDRIDDTGRRPVLRPRLLLRTDEPVRVEPGAALTSPARPAQKATVVTITPVGAGRTDVLLELSGGMGRRLAAEPGTVPGVGERLILTTLSEAFRPAAAFPDPADTPWTHGGPPL
jgi:hypothetical protein